MNKPDSPSTANQSNASQSNYNQSSDNKDEHTVPETLESQLKDVLFKPLFPDGNTVVTGALTQERVAAAAKAGIEHVINLQTKDELDFDEQAAVEAHGMVYTHLPIAGADDLKQLNLLQFDKQLRAYHGKKTLLHCSTGNRVGAFTALRAGWLRGRKMETALERGRKHGLTDLEPEVHNRLLVPR